MKPNVLNMQLKKEEIYRNVLNVERGSFDVSGSVFSFSFYTFYILSLCVSVEK